MLQRLIGIYAEMWELGTIPDEGTKGIIMLSIGWRP